MAPTKKHEQFTKDETLLLLASAGLCVLKAFIEAEAPVVSAVKLGLGAATNFQQLLESAESNGTATRLRLAVDKAKRKASARVGKMVQ